MAIGLGAERIAASLQNDNWFWLGGYDDQRLVRRGMTLSVSLKGEVRIGQGGHLPNDRIPMNRQERRMLARVARDRFEQLVAEVANNPAGAGAKPDA